LDNPDPVEWKTISDPIQIQKIQIFGRIGLQNPDPVYHWRAPRVACHIKKGNGKLVMHQKVIQMKQV